MEERTARALLLIQRFKLQELTPFTFTLPSKPPPVLFLSLQVTAFHEACYEGDLAIAKHLLKVVALHCLYAQYLLLMLWLWSSLSCLTFLAV